jgi:hypothetical protein
MWRPISSWHLFLPCTRLQTPNQGCLRWLHESMARTDGPQTLREDLLKKILCRWCVLHSFIIHGCLVVLIIRGFRLRYQVVGIIHLVKYVVGWPSKFRLIVIHKSFMNASFHGWLISSYYLFCYRLIGNLVSDVQPCRIFGSIALCFFVH